VGTIIITVSRAVIGFFLAFQRGFWFSTVLLLAFPLILAQTLCIVSAFTSSYSMSLEAYADCAGQAEQAVNGIKVVQAFSQEMKEGRAYAKLLEKAK